MSIIRIAKKYLRVLSKHQKTRVVELMILMIIGGILETGSVTLILPFMNAVMEPEKTMQNQYVSLVCGVLNISSAKVFLLFLAIVLAILYVLKNIYLLFEYSIQYRFVYGNMLEMQKRMLNNYLHRPYEFFLNAQSGEIIRSITGDIETTFSLLVTLLSMMTEVIVSGMLIISVLLITPLITIIMAVVLLLLVSLINIKLKPILKQAGKNRQKALSEMNKWLLQSIQGIKDLKVTHKEDFFENKFNEYGNLSVTALRKGQILSITPRFVIEAVSMSVIFLTVAGYIYSGSDLETIVPILSAVAMAAIRLLPSVNRISSGMTTISYAEPMLDSVIQNLGELSNGDKISLEMDLTYKDKYKQTAKINDIENSIELQEVVYSYPNTDECVLNKASMKIKKGDFIGIVGTSGAGKTTTMDIILGLLQPQEGAVFADGVNILEDRAGWLKQVGYIPQMIFMLDDTIRENVAFGVPKECIDDKKVLQALKEASLEEFVNSLPQGLDTMIGERGVRLSGGQRQRIGIARALYNNPSILLFDEATSSLDDETEAAIIESINSLKGKKTLINIAHRKSTITKCDHIYKVYDQKIEQIK